MLAVLEEAEENEGEDKCSHLHAHRGGAVQPPLGKPLNEEGRYRQNPQEQVEHLYSQYRYGLATVCQQQEKREQVIHEYYRKREQQWQRQQTVVNGLPTSRDPTSVQLGELPRAPTAQPPPSVRDFQLMLQTDHEEVTDPLGTDP